MLKASESADSDSGRTGRDWLITCAPSGCGGVKIWYSLLFYICRSLVAMLRLRQESVAP
jgi:hypothetical protein